MESKVHICEFILGILLVLGMASFLLGVAYLSACAWLPATLWLFLSLQELLLCLFLWSGNRYRKALQRRELLEEWEDSK